MYPSASDDRAVQRVRAFPGQEHLLTKAFGVLLQANKARGSPGPRKRSLLSMQHCPYGQSLPEFAADCPEGGLDLLPGWSTLYAVVVPRVGSLCASPPGVPQFIPPVDHPTGLIALHYLYPSDILPPDSRVANSMRLSTTTALWLPRILR